MRMFARTIIMLTAFCFLPSVILAGGLTVSSSGLFGSVSSTTWSASGATWAFSFNVSNTPAVTNVENTVGFDVTGAISNFSYLLNGIPVVTTPQRIRFFALGFGGLFDINFVDTLSAPDGVPVTGFVFSDGQAYSGSEASPTIQTGGYTTTAPFSVFYANGSAQQSLAGTVVNIAPAVTGGVPEPGTFALVGVACCLFGWMRRERKSV